MDMSSSSGFTPETDGNRSGNGAPEPEVSDIDIRRIIESMYTRQQQMETELQETRAALSNSEAARQQSAPAMAPPAETSTNALLRDLIRALAVNNRAEAA